MLQMSRDNVINVIGVALPGANVETLARVYEALSTRGFLKAPARKRAPSAPADPATMADADLFAHYKRTAPYEDLVFFVQHGGAAYGAIGLFDRAFDEARNLLMPRADFYKALRAYQDAWRRGTAEYLPDNGARQRALRAAQREWIHANLAASYGARATSNWPASLAPVQPAFTCPDCRAIVQGGPPMGCSRPDACPTCGEWPRPDTAPVLAAAMRRAVVQGAVPSGDGSRARFDSATVHHLPATDSPF